MDKRGQRRGTRDQTESGSKKKKRGKGNNVSRRAQSCDSAEKGAKGPSNGAHENARVGEGKKGFGRFVSAAQMAH